MPLILALSFLICAPVAQADGLGPRAIKIWLIKTDLAGEMNSMRAVAQRMDATLSEVTLPSALVAADTADEQTGFLNFDRDLLSQQTAKLIKDGGAPDLVFNSLARPARTEFVAELKRQVPGAHAVNLQDPVSRRNVYDTILYSTHLDTVLGPNTVPIVGIPTMASFAEINKLTTPREFSETGPAVAVLIGGRAKGSDLTAAHLRSLAVILNQIYAESGASFVISPSRRTDAIAFESFLSEMTAPYRVLPWLKSSADQTEYFRLLTQADYVVVTGDSMSMISDSASLGKPTFVFAPQGSLEDRHRRFILELARRDQIRPLSTNLTTWSFTIPNAAAEAATKLKARCERYLEVAREY